jgi:hypothetical protein
VGRPAAARRRELSELTISRAGARNVGFMLKPNGFFDRNPALDVPAPISDHCHHHGAM